MEQENPWWQTTTFDFVRIPKELFRNPYYAALSAESKLLYGFLLDRASLSWEQGEKWRTPEGDPFVIFTLAEIQERIHCSKPKAIALLKTLDEHNLIQRNRPKKDGPYHIVVKPFANGEKKFDLGKSKNLTRAGSESLHGQVKEFDLNKTERNNTDINNTDTIRKTAEYEIKTNIDYDILVTELPREHLDAIVEVMVDTLCTPCSSIWISGAPRQSAEVRTRLQQADCMRIRYIFDHMKQNSAPIHSYRAYYLARLWEPAGMVDTFYENWVRRDLRCKS